MPIDIACLEAFLEGAHGPTARQLAPFLEMVEWAAKNTELEEARAHRGVLVRLRWFLTCCACGRAPSTVALPPRMGCPGSLQPVPLPVPTLLTTLLLRRYARRSNPVGFGGAAFLTGSLYCSRSAGVTTRAHFLGPPVSQPRR